MVNLILLPFEMLFLVVNFIVSFVFTNGSLVFICFVTCFILLKVHEMRKQATGEKNDRT